MAEGYKPLATKYRPQRFEDVVGQEVATRTLKNAISAGRISHAYIFSGMRGVGKTTTARLLAKCLNCRSQDGPTAEPCGTCESCTEIAAGRSMDVLEIDAASNTSVDDVRALQENLMYTPARDRYKVYIVDEVHMLSKSAFNAFLKTLEEPPEHVAFVFATTELNKIPPTVLSRCLVFEFGRVSGDAIKNRLRWICEQEGVTADDAALDLIVFQSEGSIRDAISALDQVINFADGDLTYDAAMQALGLIDRDILKQMMDAIIGQNSAAAFEAIQSVVRAGADMRLFCRHCIRHVRDLLVVKTMGKETPLLPYSAGEIDILAAQAEAVSEEDLSRFFDILVKTDQDMQYSATPQFLLEAALVKMIHSTRLVSITTLIEQLQSGSLELPESPAVQAGPSSQKMEQRQEVEQAAVGSITDPKQRLMAAVEESAAKVMLRPATVVQDGHTVRLGFSSGVVAKQFERKYGTITRQAVSEVFGQEFEVAFTVNSEDSPRPADKGKKKLPVKDEDAPLPPSPPEEPREQPPAQSVKPVGGKYEQIENIVKKDDAARLLFEELDLEIETIREFNEDNVE